jgi:Methyltransferase FkbM domain
LPKAPEERPITVKKAARRLRSVLQECGAPRIIDYWSLDTEGSELTILKSFPFDAYCVLTIEHNRFSVRDEIRAFLEARGYWWVRDMGIDDCYVRARICPRDRGEAAPGIGELSVPAFWSRPGGMSFWSPLRSPSPTGSRRADSTTLDKHTARCPNR